MPSGNTYSSDNNKNNFQNRTDGNSNHQSPANFSSLDPNATNFSIHSRPSPHNPRFAALHSSPALIDTSNTISIATLNVRGINKPSKFDALFDDIFDASLSIVGLQETKLSADSGTAMFKDHVSRYCYTFTYRAFF